MSKLESLKEKLKFQKTIVKNIDNSSIHVFLTNPEAYNQIEKLNNRIDNLFTYKPNKPIEEMSNKEFRKYKRSKKRQEIGVPKNIDYKKLIIFAITFFSIAIVGAVISWIYLATVKIKPSEILNSQVEVFYREEQGDLNEGHNELFNLDTFAKNKVSSSDVKKYVTIKFTFKEKFSATEIKNIYFKLRTSGRGIGTFYINLFDTKVGETKTIYTNDSFVFENNKDFTFKQSINYKFESIENGSYLEFVFDEVKTQGLNGVAVYSLLFNKA